MKKVARVHSAPAKHWVGNGFHVHGMFTYNDRVTNLSPFLLMDYNSPRMFEPNHGNPRGVGEHPHRGFETVTIAYQGEVSHKDSYGGGGTIKEGDVQWMTAGSGVMHQEFHSDEFSKAGGMFEMVQLWVNLPAKDKMTSPKYQAITSAEIPEVTLENEAGIARIIAGNFAETTGTASTFTPINMWDIRLNTGKQQVFTIPESHNLLLLVLEGTVLVNGEHVVRASQLVSFEKGGKDVEIEANTHAKILLLSGEPIDEPVVAYGPFVMNSEEEIRQAIMDVQTGRFGKIVQ